MYSGSARGGQSACHKPQGDPIVTAGHFRCIHVIGTPCLAMRTVYGRTRTSRNLRTLSSFSLLAEAVVTTYAPQCLASWMATLPTPPEPAWISTRCPGWMLDGLQRLRRRQDKAL